MISSDDIRGYNDTIILYMLLDGESYGYEIFMFASLPRNGQMLKPKQEILATMVTGILFGAFCGVYSMLKQKESSRG